MSQVATNQIKITLIMSGCFRRMVISFLIVGATLISSNRMSNTIRRNWYLRQKADGYPTQRNERGASMQPERTDILKSSPSGASVKPGDTIFVRVPGRFEKPVIVRVLVVKLDGDTLEVELYPEFQLPVRFLKTVTKSDIESV